MNEKQRQKRAKIKARRNRILRNPLGAAREESVAILRTLNRAAMLKQLHRAIRKSGARVMPGAPPHPDANEPPPVRPLTEADAPFQVPADDETTRIVDEDIRNHMLYGGPDAPTTTNDGEKHASDQPDQDTGVHAV
jgi:hypothetical protein